MRNRILMAALVAAALALLTPSEAGAWGAVHAGYTHVGPYGVQHVGTTRAVGPYGAYSSTHVSGTGYGGTHYNYNYHVTPTNYNYSYRYTPTYNPYYGGYRYGYYR
jgi:hypothetical protein